MPLPSPGLFPSPSLLPGSVGVTAEAGKFVLTNAFVAIDGLEVSAFTHELSVELSREEIDVTPLGAVYREFMPGLEQATFSFEMFSGHWASHENMRDSFRGSLPVSVEVRPFNQAVSEENPAYTADCLIARFVPLAGDVGGASVVSVELRSVGGVLVVTEPVSSTALLPSPGLLPSGSLLPSG